MASHEVSGCLFSVRVCKPNQVIVKTGLGVTDMTISKKCVQWPFQKVCIIDMNPRNYKFNLNNMSAEMVPFNLPVVFTIGPVDPRVDPEMFLVFARRMSGLTEAELGEVVAGVVHGQTRVYSASLTIREMFEDRDKFKMQVQERIQKDLHQYGLHIYNANIAEMKDLDESNKYFENLKQKALEGATTEMRIQVAEARKQGDIGEKLRKGETKMKVAQIDADVTKAENTRLQEIEKSNLELQLVKVECQQKNDTAKTEAEYVIKQKQIELQTEYEKKTANQQLEHLRAIELSKATVTAESIVKEAEGQSEAVRKRADADLYREQRVADALLYQEERKAKAKQLMAEAQAESLKMVFEAAGNHDMAMFYLAMEHGLYERMAEQTASAVKGMNPKISIWNTGAGGANSDGDGLGSLRKLFTGLPPMLDAIQQQTDIKLPAWMPQSVPPAEGAKPAPSVAVRKD